MNLKKMSKEELEQLSYTDLTEQLLIDKKGSMNTPSLFHKICDLLELSEQEYTAKIGDYYTSLTTDKRFVILDNAEWDLKDRHIVTTVTIDDDEDDLEEVEDEEDEDEIEPEGEVDDIDAVNDDDDLDDDNDDLDDLVVMTEEELEEN